MAEEDFSLNDALTILASNISKFPLEPDSVILLILKLEDIRDYDCPSLFIDTNYNRGQNKLLVDICDIVQGVDRVAELDRNTIDVLIARIRAYYNVTQMHFRISKGDLYIKKFYNIIKTSYGKSI